LFTTLGIGDSSIWDISCSDVAGFGLEVVEDAVSSSAGDFEVSGLEGDAVAFFGACGGMEGEVEPPGSVVVPEVVVGVGVGATGD
jgi:hypothetical protein